MPGMRRREFVGLLGGAAAWPIAARAQQRRYPWSDFSIPRQLPGSNTSLYAFRPGLNDAGFVEGKNVAIEYHWADNQADRLPGLAGCRLVRRQVAVIVGAGGGVPHVVKATTATTPIIFVMGADPVRTGLVASLNRPGGNITGIVFMVAALAAKLLGLLHELVPTASVVAVLREPKYLEFEAESRQPGGSGSRHPTANPDGERRHTSGNSMPPLQRSSKPALAGYSSALVHSSSANAGNSWPWRPGMPCRPSIISASTLRLAA